MPEISIIPPSLAPRKGPTTAVKPTPVARPDASGAMPAVAISGIAAQAGEPRSLDSFSDLAPVCDQLTFNGLARIAVFDGDPFDALTECMKRSLARAEIPANSIDILVFTSGYSGWSEDLDRRFLIAADRAGLGHARPVFVGGSSCGNTCVALGVAQALLASEGAGRVLFATCDFVPDGVSRLNPPDIAVDADGVSCAVLTPADAAPKGAYRLLGTANTHSPQLAAIDAPEEHLQAFILGHLHGIQEAVDRLLNQTGVTIDAVDHFLVPNLNTSLIGIISSAMGIASDLIFSGNIADISHAQTSDCLINLDALERQIPVAAGELVMLVACSNFAWSLALLQKT